MRILLLATRYYNLGGAELYLRQFGEACAVLGHRVIVQSLHDGDMDPEDRTLPWTKINGTVAQYINHHGSKTDFIRTALKWRTSYDLVVAGHVSLAPIAWAMRRPYIVIGYGIDVWDRLPFVRHYALSRAKRIVCLSGYTAQMVYRNGAGEPGRFVVIHPAVEDRLLEAGKASVGLPHHEPFTLLTVGRLDSRERYKGHDRVIAALPEVRSALARPVIYDIVGGGNDEPRLRELTRHHNVEPMVNFWGPAQRGKLLDFYAVCDLFIMPSTHEGFGIVFLEAQAHGKPVIAGGAGSEEALLDMTTGFSTHNRLDYPLADRIIDLSQNDAKRIEMGKAGRDFVKKNFTMARFTQQVAELITSLGGSHGS